LCSALPIHFQQLLLLRSINQVQTLEVKVSLQEQNPVALSSRITSSYATTQEWGYLR